MQSVRKVLQQQTLSENVINLLMKSWTPSTFKQYSPYIICWLEFLSSRKINPFNANVNDGTKLHGKLFNESNCKYSVMNTARSELSSIFPTTTCTSFGKQSLKGMFQKIPSLPRYTVTFDVQPVFECIKEIDFSDNTSLEIYTKNLAAVVGLLSGQSLKTLYLLQTS